MIYYHLCMLPDQGVLKKSMLKYQDKSLVQTLTLFSQVKSAFMNAYVFADLNIIC